MAISVTLAADGNESAPLSLWNIGLDSWAEEASFNAAVQEDDGEVAVWDIPLSTATAQAQRWLSQQNEAMLRRQEAACVAGDFLQIWELPLDDDVSFSMSDSRRGLLPEEEALTRSLLDEMQEGDASFNIGISQLAPVANLKENVQQFQQFLKLASYVLRPTVEVASEIEGVIIARTLARSISQMKTVWRSAVAEEDQVLHLQKVRLTLETRHAIWLFMGQVLAGAASLVAKYAISSGAAAPIAFRFVTDVIQRAREEQLLIRLEELDRL